MNIDSLFSKLLLCVLSASTSVGFLSIPLRASANPGDPITAPIQVLSAPSRKPAPGPNPGFSSIARDAAGDFVVVWTSVTPCGGQLYARLFNPDGTPRGDQFQIDPSAGALQYCDTNVIAVSMDAVGDFVVAWVGYPGASQSSSVMLFAKTFDLSGAPISGRVTIDQAVSASGKTVDIYGPAVAMNDTGDFVVAWTADTSLSPPNLSPVTFADTTKLLAQRFALDGTSLADATTVASKTGPGFTSENIRPQVRIAMSATGEYAIAYRSGLAANSGIVPFNAQVYHSDGVAASLSPISLSIAAAHETYLTQHEIAVSFVANGDLVLAWSCPNSSDAKQPPPTTETIYMRRYSATNGEATGAPVKIATRMPVLNNFGEEPTISLAPLPSGGVAVVWPDPLPFGYSGNLNTGGAFGRYYAADDSPLSDAFLIASNPVVGGGNNYDIDGPINATTNALGNLLTSYGGVYAQIFAGP